MRIATLTKFSTIDYPGLISAVVFTNGCNYRCTYCHNSILIDGRHPDIDKNEVFIYLRKRKNLLDGVVLTGGEPTIQPDLAAFAEEIKSLGYRVKLDTNGSRPEALREALAYVDYVALDYKAPLRMYGAICGASGEAVQESMTLLASSSVPWEVRTTLAAELDKPALSALKEEIASIAGTNRPILHRLNKCRP